MSPGDGEQGFRVVDGLLKDRLIEDAVGEARNAAEKKTVAGIYS